MTDVVDFEDVVKNDYRPIVRQLSNLDLLKDSRLQSHAIFWANGLDFAPDFIKNLKK